MIARPNSRRGVVAAVAVAALGLTSWIPAHAASGELGGVGWWTRNPSQSAPAGGFAVALAPDGDVTVAAVRIEAADDLRAVRIEAVETGGFGQASAAISVCAAASAWEPAAGGGLDDAPAADCEAGAVELARDADAARWSADVSALVVGQVGEVSLAIVPTPGQGPLAAFDVRFAAPTTQPTVEVAFDDPEDDPGPGDPGAAPAFGGASNPPPAPPTSTFGGFDPAPSSDPVVAGPGDDPAIDRGASDDPAEVPAEDADPREFPTGDDQAFQPLVPASSGGPADHRTVGKALAYVVISALAGVVVAGGSRWARTRGLATG